MNTQELLKRVDELVSPILANLGYRLIEREYLNEMGRWILRLYIDREGAVIGLDDCERVSRAVEGVLDVEDLIPHRYSLEVSSPGVKRPLRFKEDFERYKGSYIYLKTKEPIEGRRNYKGILKELNGSFVVMIVDKKEYEIPFDAIMKAHIEEIF